MTAPISARAPRHCASVAHQIAATSVTSSYNVRLDPHQPWDLTITCDVHHAGRDGLESCPDQTGGGSAYHRQLAHDGSLGTTHVETDSELFNRILTRSFLDLQMLSMREKDQTFFAAGVPWYVALFGRDSLVTSIQTLPSSHR